MKKKNLITSVLIAAIAVGTLMGCGNNATATNAGVSTQATNKASQQETTVAAAKDETKAETKEAAKDETKAETKEAAKAETSVETAVATKATETTTAAPVFGTVTMKNGDTFPDGAVNNDVILALKELGFDTSKYENSYIDYDGSVAHLAINYNGDGEASIIHTMNKSEDNRTSDKDCLAALSAVANEYAQAEVNGLAPTFDYNHDDILDDIECVIAGIFYTNDYTFNFLDRCDGPKPVRHLN